MASRSPVKTDRRSRFTISLEHGELRCHLSIRAAPRSATRRHSCDAGMELPRRAHLSSRSNTLTASAHHRRHRAHGRNACQYNNTAIRGNLYVGNGYNRYYGHRLELCRRDHLYQCAVERDNSITRRPLDQTTGLTLSFWVQISYPVTNARVCGLSGVFDVTESGNGSLTFRYGGDLYYWPLFSFTTASLSNGSWHHLVFTADFRNNSGACYVDGVNQGNATINTTLVSQLSPIEPLP